jgi:hypothetical protein
VDQTGLAHDALTATYAYSGATTTVTLPGNEGEDSGTRTMSRTVDARACS